MGLFDGPHATPPPATNGPVFLGIGDLRQGGGLNLTEVRHIGEDDFPTWTKRVLPRAGDIVFSYEATLNRYAIIPAGFRGCLGRRLALIRSDPRKVDGRFLFYYFCGPEWRDTIAENTILGSTVDRIPLTRFPTFPVSVPSLAVQQAIGSFLSAYDALVENNTRRIAILEEMARALYREWFVELRFPGHKHVANATAGLGTCPLGWQLRQLGEVVELAYGRALRAEDRQPGSVPVYGSSGQVGFHSESLVDGPGIIVGRKGNVGSVHWSDEAFFPIDTVYYVRTELPLLYVYFNLQNQRFLNNDSAVPGLNRKQAYSLPLVIPPTDLLESFVAFVAPIFAQVRILREASENLRRTRDLLLPKLISGEIDVSKLEIDVGEPAA